MQVFKMNIMHNGRHFNQGETLESKMKYLTDADLSVLAPFLIDMPDAVEPTASPSDQPMSFAEMRKLAKEKNIPGYLKMKKDALATALKE